MDNLFVLSIGRNPDGQTGSFNVATKVSFGSVLQGEWYLQDEFLHMEVHGWKPQEVPFREGFFSNPLANLYHHIFLYTMEGLQLGSPKIGAYQ